MSKFKVNSRSDNKIFVETKSYRTILNKFQDLKKDKGKIVHVLGAPGTGKSTNIYKAIEKADLNVLDVKIELLNDSLTSRGVYHEFIKVLQVQTGATSKEEVYTYFSDFDAVIFADKFHDNAKIGFSDWTRKAGWHATGFYFLCIKDYLKYRGDLKKTNIVLQTAWRTHFMGRKYDTFTDLGPISWILVKILSIFFEVVEISYTEEETIKIVKKHVNAPESEIKKLIKKHGHKPRVICIELEKKIKNQGFLI